MHRLLILHKNFNDRSGYAGRDFVEHLHRLNQTDNRIRCDVVTDLEEFRSVWLGTGVVRPDRGAEDQIRIVVGHRSGRAAELAAGAATTAGATGAGAAA